LNKQSGDIVWGSREKVKVIWGHRNEKTKKPASYSHRTATTKRPCCIPALGDSLGAGRIRLAGAQKYVKKIKKVKIKMKKCQQALDKSKSYFCSVIKI